MARARPLYLHRKVTRHGKVTWYFWPGHGPRVRIHGEYGSPEFMATYRAALAGEPQAGAKPPKGAPESLAWLIARHRDSSAWAGLSAATRRQRENIFKHVIAGAGDFPFAQITRADIISGLEKRKDRASAANNWLETMRRLFQWAVEADLAQNDPTAGVKGVKRPKTGGFHQWTEDEVLRFEHYWPIGTRERLAMALLLYTGARRGDAARLGPQHVRNGELTFRTEKSGEEITVTLPVLPPLQSVLAQSETGAFAFVANARTGAPMSKEGFGNWFGKAAKAAGVPGNCHGLRKVAATRCAEAGATIHELNAIFGWTGTKMAAHYTEKADRVRLARRAAGLIEKNK